LSKVAYRVGSFDSRRGELQHRLKLDLILVLFILLLE
jgi:hypothetical protein